MERSRCLYKQFKNSKQFLKSVLQFTRPSPSSKYNCFNKHCIKYARIGFLVTRILPYKDRIYNSVTRILPYKIVHFRFCPYFGEYGSVKNRIFAYFMKRKKNLKSYKITFWINHKFKHVLLDSLNPICSCRLDIATTCHFLLLFPNFTNNRSTFLSTVSRTTKDILAYCHSIVIRFLLQEAVVRRCSSKQVFLKNGQISPENTCPGVFFLLFIFIFSPRYIRFDVTGDSKFYFPL